MDDDASAESAKNSRYVRASAALVRTSQARVELGADLARRLMLQEPLLDLERWRKGVEQREAIGRQARADRRAAEQLESVAAIEARIRSELTAELDRRLSEEVSYSFDHQQDGDAVLAACE
jgi:hypothetical protein